MMIKKGLKTFKKPALLLSASLGLWLGVSCQDDITTGQSLPLGDEIQFSIASDSIGENQSVGTVSRSASRVSTHFLTVIGEDSLYLEVKEEENNRPFYTATEDTVESRGASYDTEKQPLKSFFLTAFLEDGAQFMKDEVVKKNGNDWEYSPIKYWPQNQAVHFFGYGLSKSTGTLGNHDYDLKNGYKHTFSYTMPAATDEKKDAENQPDLIVTVKTNQKKQGINESVNLSFKHALSAVVFKIGGIPEVTKLKSVSFSGLYASGTGSIDQTNTITWSNTGSANATYIQTFNKDVEDGTIVNEKKDETCFMMIPQTLSNSATIEIVMEVTSPDPNQSEGTTRTHTYTLNKPLKQFITSWQPNKKYTFVISTPKEVEVEVTDKIKASNGKPMKYDLNITNTGLSDVYIRASIIGNWVLPNETETYDDDFIVAAWDPEGEGDFVWSGGSEPSASATSGWCKHSDGYYYYLNPIARGEQTAPLFESYTLTANAPMANAVLDMAIVAQAVFFKDVANVWPQEICVKLGK